MSALGEASGQESTQFKEKIYAQALEDLPIESIEQAAWAIIKTRTFATFPKIGEIRDMIGGRTEDLAEVQAAIVWQSVQKYGAVRSVVFDDPVTMAVVQQGFGGWQKLCKELLMDQQQWFIKDFARHYAAFKRSGVVTYGMLPGWADPPNQGPALIGDKQKAMWILEQGKETPLIDGFGVSQIADRLAI
jgi:hypothetical protein